MENELQPRPKQVGPRNFLSRRRKKIYHPWLCFNNCIVLSHKPHIGIFLDAQLTFEENLSVITSKANKNYGTVADIAKKFSKTGINDYVQNFCETKTRLW